MTLDEFYTRLGGKAGFEIVSKNEGPRQLRLIGRVRTDSIPTWLQVVERLLVRSEVAAWKADISKQYFMRGDKLLYGWRLILQADDVVRYLPEILVAVDSAPVVIDSPTDEVPLHGNPNRLALNNGKGAQPMGTAKTMATGLR